MEEPNKKKEYDLAERTLLFAKNVRLFVRRIPQSIANIEDGKQLVRSSGSVGANYREANQSIGKKDCTLRMKIVRKEAFESAYWLELIDVANSSNLETERERLRKEAMELTKIFGSIVSKLS